jgi:sodium transport system permease protein
VALTLVIILVQLALFGLACKFLPFNQLGLQVDVNLPDLVNIFWALVPICLFAVSLQLSLSLFAKSFKDAQSIMALLTILPMLLNMYTLFNPGVFYDWWLWVPVLGQSAAIRDIISGGSLAAFTLWKFWAVGLALTSLAFILGVKKLRHSKTIYG